MESSILFQRAGDSDGNKLSTRLGQLFLTEFTFSLVFRGTDRRFLIDAGSLSSAGLRLNFPDPWLGSMARLIFHPKTHHNFNGKMALASFGVSSRLWRRN